MRIKKITIKTLGLFAAATVLVSIASCNKNEKFNPEETKVAMTFVAAIDGAGTKADTETEKTAFVENDAVGIIHVPTTEISPMESTNFKYKYNGTKFEAENLPYYFQDRDEVTFHAYYPYDANLETGSSSTYAIELNTKEMVVTDYLYASATTTVANPSISYTGDKAFKHVMAKLTINLRSGDGIGELTNANTSVSVGNFNHKGGFIVFLGEVGREALGGENTPAPFSFTGPSHSHLLIPQPLLDENDEEDTDEVDVTVTYGGVDYNAKLKITTTDRNGKYALLAGTHYTYTITVKNTGLVISSAEIKDWNEETATGDALL